MANQLKMATVQSILTLHDRGWSQGRIAVELDVDRETVSRYVEFAKQPSQPASEAISKSVNAPRPLRGARRPGQSALSNPADASIDVLPGSHSDCDVS